MIQVLTQFAAEDAGGISALGINGKALLIQLVTFILAYLILRQYAFKPILKVLQQRRETIETGVRLGEEMQREKAELDKKVTAELHGARRQADTIIAEAHDAARSTQREAEEKARTKADSIVADAHARGEQDIQQMRGQLKKEIVGLISDATEAIIDEKVDASKDAALIDKALHTSKGGAA